MKYKYFYSGATFDHYDNYGKIEVNPDTTSQKDLEHLFSIGLQGVVRIEIKK